MTDIDSATKLMLQAIEDFEAKAKELKKLADREEKDLEAVLRLRKRLRDTAERLWQEYSRRRRAITNYNAELEKIAKYGRRITELARAPLPIQLHPLPAVKRTLKNRPDIESAVIGAASEIGGMMDRASGVYFLLDGREIVYIGQSVDVFQRVYTHVADETKRFNRACYVSIPRDELNDVEETLIALFKPKFNSRGVKHHGDDSLALVHSQPLISS